MILGIKKTTIILVFADLTAVVASLLLSTWIRLEFSFEMMRTANDVVGSFYHYLPFILIIHTIVLFVFKGHKATVISASIDEALLIVLSNLVSCFIILIFKNLRYIEFSGSIILIHFFISTLFMGGIHFSFRILRIFKNRINVSKSTKKNALIYGAGKAGRLLAKEFIQNDGYSFNIVGFIDDEKDLKNTHVQGYSVLGSGRDLESLVSKYKIEELIIAMPAASNEVKKQIASSALKAKVKSITMVSTSALFEDANIRKSLRKIEIKDLLNRPEVRFNNIEIMEKIKGNTVLITGAGGSIGSELVRQLFKYQPERLILFDINETGLYQIEQELWIKKRNNLELASVKVECLIGSIRDKHRLESIFSKYNFDYVFHAAAHKHVPLMESSPKEAVKNNIFGTKNLIDMSNKYKVKEFINISTDKAVNPTNIMGATKRFIEMMIQSQVNEASYTKYVAVRFGNVLGSNGSVIPLFQKQIESGGPVTVTHPEIVRYFMTIPEAVSLVLQATVYADSGGIFVLDMGEPVKIKDLAEKMIELSGYQPGKEIEIKYVGLRPGEKLYEELLMSEEGLKKTDNNLIYKADPMYWSSEYIKDSLAKIDQSIKQSDVRQVVKVLEEVIPTFSHQENIIKNT